MGLYNGQNLSSGFLFSRPGLNTVDGEPIRTRAAVNIEVNSNQTRVNVISLRKVTPFE